MRRTERKRKKHSNSTWIDSRSLLWHTNAHARDRQGFDTASFRTRESLPGHALLPTPLSPSSPSPSTGPTSLESLLMVNQQYPITPSQLYQLLLSASTDSLSFPIRSKQPACSPSPLPGFLRNSTNTNPAQHHHLSSQPAIFFSCSAHDGPPDPRLALPSQTHHRQAHQKAQSVL